MFGSLPKTPTSPTRQGVIAESLNSPPNNMPYRPHTAGRGKRNYRHNNRNYNERGGSLQPRPLYVPTPNTHTTQPSKQILCTQLYLIFNHNQIKSYLPQIKEPSNIRKHLQPQSSSINTRNLMDIPYSIPTIPLCILLQSKTNKMELLRMKQDIELRLSPIITQTRWRPQDATAEDHGEYHPNHTTYKTNQLTHSKKPQTLKLPSSLNQPKQTQHKYQIIGYKHIHKMSKQRDSTEFPKFPTAKDVQEELADIERFNALNQTTTQQLTDKSHSEKNKPVKKTIGDYPFKKSLELADELSDAADPKTRYKFWANENLSAGRDTPWEFKDIQFDAEQGKYFVIYQGTKTFLKKSAAHGDTISTTNYETKDNEDFIMANNEIEEMEPDETKSSEMVSNTTKPTETANEPTEPSSTNTSNLPPSTQRMEDDDDDDDDIISPFDPTRDSIFNKWRKKQAQQEQKDNSNNNNNNNNNTSSSPPLSHVMYGQIATKNNNNNTSSSPPLSHIMYGQFTTNNNNNNNSNNNNGNNVETSPDNEEYALFDSPPTTTIVINDTTGTTYTRTPTTTTANQGTQTGEEIYSFNINNNNNDDTKYVHPLHQYTIDTQTHEHQHKQHDRINIKVSQSKTNSKYTNVNIHHNNSTNNAINYRYNHFQQMKVFNQYWITNSKVRNNIDDDGLFTEIERMWKYICNNLCIVHKTGTTTFIFKFNIYSTVPTKKHLNSSTPNRIKPISKRTTMSDQRNLNSPKLNKTHEKITALYQQDPNNHHKSYSLECYHDHHRHLKCDCYKQELPAGWIHTVYLNNHNKRGNNLYLEIKHEELRKYINKTLRKHKRYLNKKRATKYMNKTLTTTISRPGALEIHYKHKHKAI